MIFRFQIDTSNAAFDGSMTDVVQEIQRIFESVSQRLIDGADSGSCMDINGNTVGKWSYRKGRLHA